MTRSLRVVPLLLATACADAAVELEPVTGEPAVREDCDAAHDDAFADCVDVFTPAAPASFGHDALPQIVLGPPRIEAGAAGSLDVASLGCGGSITLGFADDELVDGPGDDLIVFENAFRTGDTTFAEPAAVLVSEDGHTWWAFACAADEGALDAGGCAGVTPTLALDAADAVDPARAGGDAFDLGELGLTHARWVRLRDRTREFYGDDTWCVGAAAGFDLDAVAAVGWP